MISILFESGDIPHVPGERIAEEKEGGMYLILAPELPNCISVNATGREIIDLCDGKRSIKEITEAISLRKGENPEENLPAILVFFNYLEERKFAFTRPLKLEEFSPRKPEKLATLWLNITHECNLHCLHCHSSFGSPLESELTTREIIALMEEVSHFDECSLVISGGEPFCRKDIAEIVSRASEYFGDKALIVTNGTLITDELAEHLAQSRIDVQISLEGPDEESNDAIRGKGVFGKALKTIRKLKSLGLTPLVRMTLLKSNVNKVREIMEFVNREGLGAVVLGTLQMSGRAHEFLRKIDLTTDELIKAYREIRKLDPDSAFIKFGENIRPAVTRCEKLDLCGAGTGILSIGADGGVYPCPGLIYPEFLAGNIREKSLEEIWKESSVLKEIRCLSVSKIPGCKDCSIRYLCGGGCLVDIFWEHGNLYGKTPRCEFLRAMKWDELKRTAYEKKQMR